MEDYAMHYDEKDLRYEAVRSWNGWRVCMHVPHRRFPYYLGTVRNGKASWWCDWLYSRSYTEKTAKKYVSALEKGEIK